MFTKGVAITFAVGWVLANAHAVTQTNLLDTTFNPGAGAQNGFVESMAIQPDGKILICGNFTSFNNQPKSYIARLNADGSVDPSFTANVSYWVRFMALQADEKIVIGGYFTSAGGQSRKLVARLNSDGSLDTTFNPGTGATGILGAGIDGNADPFIFTIAIQPDQKIIIGGNFDTFNGVGRRGIARLNTNGTLDSSFVVGAGVNSWVRSSLVQTNNQIMLSGWFTSYDNHSYNRMVRLNSDGSADSTFNANFGDQTAAYAMAPLTNGKIIVGGHTVNPSSAFQQEVVRLNSTGSYDTTFNPGGSGANDKVESVALQSDGKIVIGGYFSLYNGVPVDTVARLNADGTLDSAFGASVNNWIWTVRLQSDGKVLISGAFTTVNGVSRSGIARLNSTPTAASWSLFNPTKFSNRFEVSVLTQSGKNYTLQYKNALADSNWISLPAVAGNGAIKTLTDSNPALGYRFYRILEN